MKKGIIFLLLSSLCLLTPLTAKGSPSAISGDIFPWETQCNRNLRKYTHWQYGDSRKETQYAAAFSEDRKYLFVAAKCFFHTADGNNRPPRDSLALHITTSQKNTITALVGLDEGPHVIPAKLYPAAAGALPKNLPAQAETKCCPDHWEMELRLDVSDLRQKPDWFPSWIIEITRQTPTPQTHTFPLVVPRQDASGKEMNLYYCVVRALPGATDQNTYVIHKSRQAVDPIDTWDSPAWKDIPELFLRYEHWKPGLSGNFIPDVSAKLQYAADTIYVLYKVQDCFIRGDCKNDQGMVCFDSAVELFLRPQGSSCYFNLEANCIGTILLYQNHFEGEKKISIPVSADKLKKILRHSSLPRDLSGEISRPTTWYLSLQIPCASLGINTREFPLAGQTWRGNIYKCADKTSHPCWLAWSKCGIFHEMEAFGFFLFEK